MLVTVPSAVRRVAARARPAGRRVALVSKRRRTLPCARRARKSARRTTTILHVQSCTVRARARRARSIISDQRPDAHGARTRARAKPQTEPKRRPQGKRTRVYTDSRFQFHTATRTGHKFQVTNFVHGRPRGSVAARERACATLRPAGCGQRAGRSRPRHCGLISAIISLKFATRTTDRDGCYTCILA